MTTILERKQERRREQRARRKLRQWDLILQKSRLRGEPTLDNYGGYRIVDLYTNVLIEGSRYDLSLEFVEEWIREAEAEAAAG